MAASAAAHDVVRTAKARSKSSSHAGNTMTPSPLTSSHSHSTTCSLTILRPAAHSDSEARTRTRSLGGAASAAATRTGAPARFGPDMPICASATAAVPSTSPSQSRPRSKDDNDDDEAANRRPRMSFASGTGSAQADQRQHQEQDAHPQREQDDHAQAQDHHVQVHLIGDPDILLPFLDRPQEAAELLLSNPTNATLKERLQSCLSTSRSSSSPSKTDWHTFLDILTTDREHLPDLDWLERLRAIVAAKSLELWASLERCLGAQCLLYMHNRHDAALEGSEALACKSWLDDSTPEADSEALAIDDEDDEEDAGTTSTSSPSAVATSSRFHIASPRTVESEASEDDDDEVGSGFVLRSWTEHAPVSPRAVSPSAPAHQRTKLPARRHSSGYQRPRPRGSVSGSESLSAGASTSTSGHGAEESSAASSQPASMHSSIQFEVLHDVPTTFREKVGNLQHTSRVELEQARRLEGGGGGGGGNPPGNNQHGSGSSGHLHAPSNAGMNEASSHQHQPPPQSYSPVKLRSALHLPLAECPEGASLTDIVEEGSPRDATAAATAASSAQSTGGARARSRTTSASGDKSGGGAGGVLAPLRRRLSTSLSELARLGSRDGGAEGESAVGLTGSEESEADDPLEAFMLANEGRFAGFRISTGPENMSGQTQTPSTNASESQRSSWVSHATADTETTSATTSPSDFHSRHGSMSAASEGSPSGDKERKIRFSRHSRLSSLFTSPLSTHTDHARGSPQHEAESKHASGGPRSRRAATSAGVLLNPSVSGLGLSTTSTTDTSSTQALEAVQREGKDMIGPDHPHRATPSEMAHRFSQHLRHLHAHLPPPAKSSSSAAGAASPSSSIGPSSFANHRRRASEAGTATTPKTERDPIASRTGGGGGGRTVLPTPSPGGALTRPSPAGFYGQQHGGDVSPSAKAALERSQAASKGFQLGAFGSGSLGSRRGQHLFEGTALSRVGMAPAAEEGATPKTAKAEVGVGAAAASMPASGARSPASAEEQRALAAGEQRRRSLSFALNFGGLTLTPQRRQGGAGVSGGAHGSREASPHGGTPLVEGPGAESIKETPILPSGLTMTAAHTPVPHSGEATDDRDVDEDDDAAAISPAELAALAESAGLDKDLDLGLLPDGRTRHPSASHRSSRSSRSSKGSRSGSDSGAGGAGGGSSSGGASNAVLAFRAGLKSMMGRRQMSSSDYSPRLGSAVVAEGEIGAEDELVSKVRNQVQAEGPAAAQAGIVTARPQISPPPAEDDHPGGTEHQASHSPPANDNNDGQSGRQRNYSSSSQVKTPTMLSAPVLGLEMGSSAAAAGLGHPGTPKADDDGPSDKFVAKIEANNAASASAAASAAVPSSGASGTAPTLPHRPSYFTARGGSGVIEMGSQPVPPVHTAAVAEADLAVPSLGASGLPLSAPPSEAKERSVSSARGLSGEAAPSKPIETSTSTDGGQTEFQHHLESIQRRAQLSGGGRSGFALGGGFALPKPTGALHRPSHSSPGPGYGHETPARKPALSPGARLGVPYPSGGAHGASTTTSTSTSQWAFPSTSPRAYPSRPLEALTVARYARERGLDPTGQYGGGVHLSNYKRSRAHSSGSTWSESAMSTGSQAIASSEGSTIGAPEEYASVYLGGASDVGTPSGTERSLSPRGRHGLVDTPEEEEGDAEGEEDDEYDDDEEGQHGEGRRQRGQKMSLSAGGLVMTRSGTLKAATDSGKARHVHYADAAEAGHDPDDAVPSACPVEERSTQTTR